MFLGSDGYIPNRISGDSLQEPTKKITSYCTLHKYIHYFIYSQIKDSISQSFNEPTKQNINSLFVIRNKMIFNHSLCINTILFMRLVTFHTSKFYKKLFITSTSNGIIRSSSLSFISFQFCVVYPDQAWWYSSKSATVPVFTCYGAATTILHQTDSGTMSKRVHHSWQELSTSNLLIQ